MVSVRSDSLVNLNVNGKPYKLNVDPSRTLLEVIRDDLDLTGAKKACDKGECGSCIVLLGSKGVMSCLLPASPASMETRQDFHFAWAEIKIMSCLLLVRID